MELTKKEKKAKRIDRKRDKLKSGDFWLMLIVMILVIFGLIMVFSASYYYSISQAGTAYSYLLRHGLWVILGTAAMIAGASLDYRIYRKCAVAVLIIIGIMLKTLEYELMLHYILAFSIMLMIIFIVSGIGIKILNEIYKRAIEYKEENDFTI